MYTHVHMHTRKHTYTHSKRTRVIYMIIGAMVLLMSSCSPVKRIERIYKRHPYLLEAKTDTLHYRDTIIFRDTIIDTIPGIDYSNLIPTDLLEDTVSIDTGNVHIKLIYVTNPEDSLRYLYISAKLDSIINTIPIEKEIPVEADISYQKNTVKITKTKKPFPWWMLFMLSIAIVTLLIIKQFKR